MPILSKYARRPKFDNFIRGLPKHLAILEVGCGDGWLGRYLNSAGYCNYVGLDLAGPADLVGSILEWRALGIKPESFDVIIAFEVVEHVDCFHELFNILKPGGLMMLTSPLPRMDWLCHFLEKLDLNQPRVNPHSHLLRFEGVPLLEPLELKTVYTISQ